MASIIAFFRSVYFKPLLCGSLSLLVTLSLLGDAPVAAEATAFNQLPTVYRGALAGAIYNDGADAQIVLQNLVIGKEYTVQLWVADPRPGFSANDGVVVDDNTALLLKYNHRDMAGGVGSHLTGTFTADATTQVLRLKGTQATQLNAMQVRASEVPLSPLYYWDANGTSAGFGTAGGTWGVDGWWSSDSLGAMEPDGAVQTDNNARLALGSNVDGLNSGTIAVEGTQAFHELTFGMASEDLILDGGQLSLDTPTAAIRLNRRCNKITSTLTSGGTLEVYPLGTLINYGFPSKTEFVLFHGARLKDYHSLETLMTGGGISANNRPATTTLHHMTQTDEEWEAQVQCLDDNKTKCVKLKLKQVNEDITAQVVYVKYLGVADLGFNFDEGGTEFGLALTPTAGSAYGLSPIKLLPHDTQLLQYVFNETLTTTFQTIAEDVALTDVLDIECWMTGGQMNNQVSPAKTVYLERKAARATFQAQIQDGGYVKCVKVELQQNGADIQARAIGTAYITASSPGRNFNLEGTQSGTYAVRAIALKCTRPVLEFSAESNFAGNLNIFNAEVKLSGVWGEDGVYAGDILNVGRLALIGNRAQTLEGNISGSGALVVDKITEKPISYDTRLTEQPVVIALNAQLVDYTHAKGRFSAIYLSNPSDTKSFHFVNDGQVATVQFQVKDGQLIKCAKVQFEQVGNDITAKIVYTRYTNDPNDDQLGVDFDEISSSSHLYYIDSVQLVPAFFAPVILSGNNSYYGGTYIYGGIVEAISANSIPPYGGIWVDGGHLVLNSSKTGVNDVLGGNTSPVVVMNGGTLEVRGTRNLGSSRPVTVDNATLLLTANTTSDSDNYVGKLTLKDGARVEGHAIRVGYANSALANWEVLGTAPSFVATDIYALNGTWIINVADVTGDVTSDLVLAGSLKNYGGGFAPFELQKTGVGTLSLAGANQAYSGNVSILDGVLRLDSTTALTTANQVTVQGGQLVGTGFDNELGTLILAGGALQMGSGTLVCDVLTLTDNSEVMLGDGNLIFAASDSVTWEEGATLNLVGEFKQRHIRFGENQAGLTATQLSAIRINGKAYQALKLNAAGFLTLDVGTLISVR